MSEKTFPISYLVQSLILRAHSSHLCSLTIRVCFLPVECLHITPGGTLREFAGRARYVEPIFRFILLRFGLRWIAALRGHLPEILYIRRKRPERGTLVADVHADVMLHEEAPK